MHINRHALVIGGTGMLSEVSLYLAQFGYEVSVIGRSKTKFEALLKKQPANIFPLFTDYNKEEVFSIIEKAILERGAFDLIVSWTPNYAALERICRMNTGISAFTLVHVKGSGRYFKDEEIDIPENGKYQKVFLGFIIEKSGSRWLTHEEIAEGVIKQINSEEKQSVIGQIEPYDKKPL